MTEKRLRLHHQILFALVGVLALFGVSATQALAQQGGNDRGGDGPDSPGGSDNFTLPGYGNTQRTINPGPKIRPNIPQEREAERKPRRFKKQAIRKPRKARRFPVETAASGMPPAGEDRFINDEVIIRFRLSADQRAMDNLVARTGLRHISGRTFGMAGATLHRYEIASGQPVSAILPILEADPTVVYAQPNYLYELQQAAKTAANLQYAFDRLKFGTIHERTRGKGVTVAVIDTGVERDHPGFAGADLAIVDVSDGGADRVTAHGTAMTGIIGSTGSVTGIAPDARLVGIAAFSADDDGNVTGNSWTVARAADAAFDEKARIINMSFAGPADPLVANAVKGLAKNGAIIFAASGNLGPKSDVQYPAGYDEAYATTATDKSDAIYSRASIGNHLAFAAPGVEILSLAPKGGYSLQTGTSVATAHLSGLAALLVAANPSISSDRVVELLENSSQDLGDPGRDPVFGYGLPDASAALAADLQ